jgi:hypothetical protein
LFFYVYQCVTMPRAGRHGIRFSFTQRGECTRPQNRRADNDRLTGADAHTIPQLSTDSSTRLAAIKPDSRRVSQKTFWEFAAQMLPTGKGSLCKLLKRWWTWSGSVLHGVLIIRKFLILRIPKKPKMPSLPNRLYDFCTWTSQKPKLLATRDFL